LFNSKLNDQKLVYHTPLGFKFKNVTEERELPRRGTCENPGWMKDLYQYRKGMILWWSF